MDVVEVITENRKAPGLAERRTGRTQDEAVVAGDFLDFVQQLIPEQQSPRTFERSLPAGKPEEELGSVSKSDEMDSLHDPALQKAGSGDAELKEVLREGQDGEREIVRGTVEKGSRNTATSLVKEEQLLETKPGKSPETTAAPHKLEKAKAAIAGILTNIFTAKKGADGNGNTLNDALNANAKSPSGNAPALTSEQKNSTGNSGEANLRQVEEKSPDKPIASASDSQLQAAQSLTERTPAESLKPATVVNVISSPRMLQLQTPNFPQIVALRQANLVQAVERIEKILFQTAAQRDNRHVNFTFEDNPYGLKKIQFDNNDTDSRATIFVQSEVTRTELEKILPQMNQNLWARGIHFEALDVAVWKRPDRFQPGERQNAKRFKTHQMTGLRDETASVAGIFKAQNFGYNSMEVLA